MTPFERVNDGNPKSLSHPSVSIGAMEFRFSQLVMPGTQSTRVSIQKDNKCFTNLAQLSPWCCDWSVLSLLTAETMVGFMVTELVLAADEKKKSKCKDRLITRLHLSIFLVVRLYRSMFVYCFHLMHYLIRHRHTCTYKGKDRHARLYAKIDLSKEACKDSKEKRCKAVRSV